MGKSRLNYKALSRTVSAAPRPNSYKNGLVWKWLQFVTAGDDDCGEAIRLMRHRMDMPNQFPHRTYLLNYLTKRCKMETARAQRVHVHLWNLYAEYRDAALRSAEPVRAGVTRNPWKPETTVDDPDANTPNVSKFLSR